MKDYMKPSLRNPSVINLACQLKNEMHEVSFSTIILRTDDKKMSKNGMEVNLHLKGLFEGSVFSERGRGEGEGYGINLMPPSCFVNN